VPAQPAPPLATRTATPTRSSAQATATTVALTSRAAYLRGQSFWQQGDFTRAVAELSQAIQIRPDYGEAYNLRALATVGTNDLDQALADANMTVQLERTANRLDTRAYVHLRRTEYAAALEDYNAAFALTRNPSSANYWLGRGLTYHALGNLTDARSDIESGLSRISGTPDPQLVDLETRARQALATLPTPISTATAPRGGAR
jgi:tetratricopeptide (TPR) repeat protein